MDTIITIVVVILILTFIAKVGSKLWRLLGFILVGAVIWIFWQEIMSEINQLMQSIESGEIWDNLVRWGSALWQALVQWFGRLVN